MPPSLIERDSTLRQRTGRARRPVPARRSRAATRRTCSRRPRRSMPRLDGTRGRGVAGRYDHAARYLPTREDSSVGRPPCRTRPTLRQALLSALQSTPFRQACSIPSSTTSSARAICRRSARKTSRARRSKRGSAACCSSADDHWTGLVTLTGLQRSRRAGAARRRNRRRDAARPQAGVRGSRRAPARAHPLVPGGLGRAAGRSSSSSRCVTSARVRRVLAPMALTTLLVLGAAARRRRVAQPVPPDRAGAGGRARPRLRAVLRARRATIPPSSAGRCTPCSSARCRR